MSLFCFSFTLVVVLEYLRTCCMKLSSSYFITTSDLFFFNEGIWGFSYSVCLLTLSFKDCFTLVYVFDVYNSAQLINNQAFIR